MYALCASLSITTLQEQQGTIWRQSEQLVFRDAALQASAGRETALKDEPKRYTARRALPDTHVPLHQSAQHHSLSWRLSTSLPLLTR